jgi:hypothetical protein
VEAIYILSKQVDSSQESCITFLPGLCIQRKRAYKLLENHIKAIINDCSLLIPFNSYGMPLLDFNKIHIAKHISVYAHQYLPLFKYKGRNRVIYGIAVPKKIKRH